MSRRHLWVEYRDEDGVLVSRSLLFPATEADQTTLDILFQQLYQSWLEYRMDTATLLLSPEWQIVQAISRIIPTAPMLRLNLRWIRKDPTLFESLFLHQGATRPGKLIELHHYELTPREPWKEGDPITLADLPFPTSGDRHADTIALQLYHFNCPDGKIIHHWLDAGTRYNVQRVLSQLNRPVEERIEDYLKEIYEANKAESPEEFEYDLFDF